MTFPTIPLVYAAIPRKVLQAGRSSPILMACRTTDGASEPYSEYVVKLYSSFEVGKRSLARELYASLLAMYLGLSVPDVAIVVIPPSLSGAVADAGLSQRLQSSVGHNFGSKYVRQTSLATDGSLSAEGAKNAFRVFAFDMLIQNLDRRPDKPNAFVSGDEFIIFDHELAFSGCASPALWIGGAPKPWEITKLTPKDHLFYRELRGNSTLDFDGVAAKVASIETGMLSEICAMIPVPWRSSEVDDISSHILLVVHHDR